MKPYYQDNVVTIYHADCRDILPSIEPGSIDLVFADPPYGTGKDYLSYNDNSLVRIDSWLPLCRALGLCIVTPGYINMFRYPQPDHVGIRIDKTAQSPATIAWMNKWEPIFFYGKLLNPKMRLAWDVIETASQTERVHEPLNHPCPKPIHLLLVLIEQLTLPSHIILDPFMGSGTTLRAAKNLGRKAVGIEIEEKYCEMAVRRLAQEVLC